MDDRRHSPKRVLISAAMISSIVSMPFFQAISLKTPIDPNGVKTPPSGGPYYIASRDVGRSIL